MVSIGKIFAIKFLFKPEKMLDNKMVKGINRPKIKEKKDNLIAELQGLLHVPFDFDFLGSQIIYHGYNS